ncbi:hypothetical protein LINPERHAP1_LOCUS37738, partial [Linum perenne]
FSHSFPYPDLVRNSSQALYSIFRKEPTVRVPCFSNFSSDELCRRRNPSLKPLINHLRPRKPSSKATRLKIYFRSS